MQGWSWVQGSTLWHYFEGDAVSLCRKAEVPNPEAPVLYKSPPITGKIAGQIQHGKACTACRRKLDGDTKKVQRPTGEDAV